MAKPTKKVTSLSAPVRTTDYKIKSTWKVPGDLKKQASKLRVQWILDVAGKDPKEKDYISDSKTSDTVNLNKFEYAKNKFYTRGDFYPGTAEKKSNRRLYGITCKVNGRNKDGNGPSVSKKGTFKAPRKPSIANLEFDPETGVVSTTITTDAGSDMRERYDTWYRVEVTKPASLGGNWSKDYSTKSLEKSVTYDASNYQLMHPDNDYIRVVVKSYARGFAGNSAWAVGNDGNTPYKDFYVAYPKQATLGKPVVTSKSMSGKCNIAINTNSTTQHPVDRVKLEYLPNCTYTKKEQLPGDGWVTSSIIDNGDCKGLSIPVAEIMPDRGKHVWLRVKSHHANEDVLYRYSEPVEVDALYVEAPTAADDEISILNVTSGVNGSSAVVTLGWNSDGQDDSTGTELSWSEEEDTWRSTESPSTYTFTWSDGGSTNPLYWLTEDTIVVSGKDYYSYNSQTGVYTKVTNPTGNPHAQGYYEKYIDHATIVIKGLEEGSKYYIKARRYMDTDEGTSYSPYSNSDTPRTIIPNQKASAVVATCDRYISEGESFTVRWTLSGGVQTRWDIIQNTWYELTDDTEVEKEQQYDPETGQYTDGAEKSYYKKIGDVYTKVVPEGDEDPSSEGWYEQYGGTTLAFGENSIGSAQLSSDVIKQFGVDNRISFAVYVTTGSEPAISNTLDVFMSEPPTISLDAPAVLTSQTSDSSYSFDVTASSICDLIVIVTADGSAGEYPQGTIDQVGGDTVFSNRFEAFEWTLSQGVYETTINLPGNLDFFDLGRYHLSVVAEDRSSKLRSAELEHDFTVEWARKAGYPADYVELTYIDETDEDGNHVQAVQIDLTPPPESYILSEDTEVVENKSYYSRSGSETEESPYVFTEVTPSAGDNPSTQGWYELSNDVYDIYRMDVEKPSLIGSDFPLFFTTIDEYAPFGKDIDLVYRIALRTEDGDVEFADIEYHAECENIRFDWQDGYVELPYGLTMGDSFKKDIEIRKHMNGSLDGYWNNSVERKSSLSSDVIRIIQPDDIAMVRLLARYSGPVFVRLPYGSAFEANVEVTDLSRKNEAVMHVAFDATEVGLTQEFSLPVPNTTDETEEP